MAHDRREFLPAAVRSVLAQTFPTAEMEMVIVHSLGDFPIDPSHSGLEIRSIPTEKRGIGEKLALGVGACRGRVVAFLEDDDVWAPTKLARVAAAFDGDLQLGFYHNDFLVWPASNPTAPVPVALGSVGPESARSSERLRPSTLPLRAARRILRHGGLLNTSSIAVRRDLLLQSLPGLARALVSAEMALFIPAVRADALLEFDPAILTGYRQHPRAATAIPGGSLEETLGSIGDRATGAIAEFQSIQREGIPAGPRAVVRFLTFSLEIRSVVAALPPSRWKAVQVLRGHLSELRWLGPPNTWPAQEVRLLLEYILSPTLARARLYRRTIRDAPIG